ncbi:hypothetical protein HUU59_01100 [bacterium]|nr:hypothetical protein [bacterium]
MPRVKRIRTALFKPSPKSKAVDSRIVLYQNFKANASRLASRKPPIREFIVWGQSGLVGDFDSLEEAFMAGHRSCNGASFIVQEKSDVDYLVRSKRKFVSA